MRAAEDEVLDAAQARLELQGLASRLAVQQQHSAATKQHQELQGRYICCGYLCMDMLIESACRGMLDTMLLSSTCCSVIAYAALLCAPRF